MRGSFNGMNDFASLGRLVCTIALLAAASCTGANLDDRPCNTDADCLTDEGYRCIDDVCAKPSDVDAGQDRAWDCQVGTAVQGDDTCDCGCGDDDPDCGEDYNLGACDIDWCYLRYGGDPVTNTALSSDPALCQGDVD